MEGIPAPFPANTQFTVLPITSTVHSSTHREDYCDWVQFISSATYLNYNEILVALFH